MLRKQSELIGRKRRRAHSGRWLPAALASAALVALNESETADASWLWTPRTQLSHVSSPDSGSTVEWAHEGRTGDTLAHFTVRVWDGADPNFDGRGYYLRLGADSTWGSAWEHRELVTYRGNDASSTDHHILEDSSGDIHLVSEVRPYPGMGTRIMIGYKHRDEAHWSADSLAFLVNESDTSCTSPHMFLQEADGDTLHVTFRHGPDTAPYMKYTRKALSDAEDAWDAESFVTNKFGAGVVFVDDSGQAHFFGQRAVGDTSYVYHLRGSYPGPGGNWSLTETSWKYALPTAPPLMAGSEAGDDGGVSTLTSGSYLYASWHGWVAHGGTRIPEVFVARLDLTNYQWSTVQVTLSDGIPSRRPRLVATGDTPPRFHLTFHEPLAPRDLSTWTAADTTRIWHVYNTDDPMDAADWSPPTEIARERRTTSQWPIFVAREDTLWVAYTSHDDDDSADADWEAWALKGWRVDDAVTGEETWAGTVYLDEDYIVDEGDTLVVAPGTRVYGRATAAADSAKVELIVRGQLIAEGTSGDPIEFAMYEGDATAGDTWGGIRFELEGCYRTGYGYAGVTQPLSSIAHTSIADAAQGILIADYGTPNLAAVTFAGIKDDRHIVLESDAVIPYGYWPGGVCNGYPFTEVSGTWDLVGGTHVVASTTTLQDAGWLGESGRIDLLVYGNLVTGGSAATGDQVFFEPDAPDSTGDNWGGVFFTKFTRGSLLDWADLGFAANPVFIDYPDSLVGISNTRVHSFADVGVWVHGSLGEGGQVSDCTVVRGNEIDESLGAMGVFLDGVDQFAVTGTTVDLANLQDDEGGTGIGVGFSKSACETTPPSQRTLLIQDNYVLGPSRDVDLGADYAGLRLTWVCGSEDRDVDILGNWVDGWKYAGAVFSQTADVTVGCNVVVENLRAVDIYRDNEPTGAAIRFRYNKLEATASDSTYYTLQTNDAVKAKLGPSSDALERGLNRLKVNVAKTKFIIENDPDSLDVLDARDTFWYADTLFTAASDTSKIKDRLAPAGFNVDFSGFRTDDSGQPRDCWPAAPAGIGSSMISGGRYGVAPEEADPQATAVVEVPRVLGLGQPRPNPSRGGVVLSLAVPPDKVGTYAVAAHDVRGRRVWATRQVVEQAGVFPVNWNGRDDAGRRVGTGVYFLRLTGPEGFVQTRKLTLLR